MERVTLGDTGREGESEVSRRTLTAELGTTGMAVNHYRVAPGEGLPSGLHAHMDQEEVFVVLSGEATFECLPADDGPTSVTVAAGQAVRFAPREFQSGRNHADETLEVLALGAPRESEDVRIPVDCATCGHADLRLDTDGELTFVCPNCGAESVPRPCPDCGGEELRITLAEEGATVAICSGCGATYDRPPTED